MRRTRITAATCGALTVVAAVLCPGTAMAVDVDSPADSFTTEDAWGVQGSYVGPAGDDGVIVEQSDADSGVSFTVVSSDGRPRLTTAIRGGGTRQEAYWAGWESAHPGLFVLTDSGESTQVLVYNGFARGASVTPALQESLDGKVDTAVPSGNGLLLTLNTGLSVNLTGDPSELPKNITGGSALAGTSGGFLVGSSDGSDAHWVGADAGWSIADGRPDHVAGSGRVVAVRGGYVVVEWDAALSLVSLPSGETVSTVKDAGKVPAGAALVLSDDGRWAGIGTVVFEVGGDRGSTLDQLPGDARISVIHDRVAYAVGAGDGGAGYAVDVRTGEGVSSSFTSAPFAVIDGSVGVFKAGDEVAGLRFKTAAE